MHNLFQETLYRKLASKVHMTNKYMKDWHKDMFTLSHFNKTVIAENDIEQVNGFKWKDPASQWSPVSDVILTK